jgi:hypothetical protein
MAGLMARREITGGHLVIDAGADTRNGVIIEQWLQRFAGQTVKIGRSNGLEMPCAGNSRGDSPIKLSRPLGDAVQTLQRTRHLMPLARCWRAQV